MQQEEVSFGGGLMTFCVGSSLHKRGCLSWSDAPPPKSLLPTYPWSSSFPLPSLVWGHQACFHCQLGLYLPQGGPQSIPYWSYVHIHMLGRGLSHGGLVAANSGKDKVNQEPRPTSEYQVVWTIPSNCRLGGIIGMHYFSQMRWPVGLFVFSQLSDHAHNCLVWSLWAH